MNDHNVYQTNNSETEETPEQAQQEREKEMQDDEEELHKLLLPNVHDLPLTPPSAIDFNFVAYFAPDFLKPGHDQYVYRHANGLCVIGLAPTHVAFKDEGGITAVDFNVGKSDRSGFKVTGKRKKNAQHFESNTAVCKVCTNNDSYIVRQIEKDTLRSSCLNRQIGSRSRVHCWALKTTREREKNAKSLNALVHPEAVNKISCSHKCFCF
ncbi:actin-binding transcription modulator [Citrus sinensis]|nr:actin-binding transcription modulator [Citrus sinensis]